MLACLVAALATTWALADCKKAGACSPGARSDCVCTSGLKGSQTCRADGTGLGVCQCEGGGGGNGGSGGAAATQGSGGTVSASSSGQGGIGGAGGQVGQGGGCEGPDCPACMSSQCAKDACAAEVAACEKNPDCGKFESCISNCKDAQCPMACQMSYPTGVKDYAAKAACLLCSPKACKALCDPNHMCK